MIFDTCTATLVPLGQARQCHPNYLGVITHKEVTVATPQAMFEGGACCVTVIMVADGGNL